MVDAAIENVIRSYTNKARYAGIPVSRVFLFGSHARGEARQDSDIDLVIVVKDCVGHSERELTGRLWRLRASSDSRIEPVLATQEEWDAEEGRLILQAAKQNAIEVDVSNAVAPPGVAASGS